MSEGTDPAPEAEEPGPDDRCPFRQVDARGEVVCVPLGASLYKAMSHRHVWCVQNRWTECPVYHFARL